MHLPGDGALCSLGDTTSGCQEFWTEHKSEKIHMKGVRDDTIYLGPPSLHCDLTSSMLMKSIINSMWTTFLLPHQSGQFQSPGSKCLLGIFILFLAVNGIPRHCPQPVTPFMLSTPFLKCIPICSLLSVPTATKQVLGTFHLDSCNSPLARLPASSHSTLPGAS